MRKVLVAALALLVSGCPTPQPLPGGPQPEYEPPRAFPGESASADAEVDIAPDSAPFGDPAALTKEIDAYMAGYGAKWGEAYAPSGMLVVAWNGKVVYQRGYGKIDRSIGAIPNMDTQFRIGSLTKQFTAAATLKLMEQGAIKLDDSAKKYVPELPDAFAPVTIAMLLHQTSGIPAYTDDAELMKRKKDAVSEADMLAWVGKQQPKFPADSKWAYSNTNYYLLGVVIERASKDTYDAYLKKTILDPAGMKTAGPNPGKDAAIGYERTPADTIVAADVVSNSLPFAAGELYASPNDFLAWDAALAGKKLFSDALKTTMFTVAKNNYAMGWVIEVRGGAGVTWHNGGIDGFSSYFARTPDKGITVVLLSNVQEFDATKPGQDVLSMALGGGPVSAPAERDMVAMDSMLGSALAGEFSLSADSEKALRDKGAPDTLIDSVMGFSFTFDKGGLTGKPSGQSPLVFHKAPDGTVFNPTASVDVTPDLDGGKTDKPVKGFTVKQHDLTLVYVRGKYTPKPAPKDGDKGGKDPSGGKPKPPPKPATPPPATPPPATPPPATPPPAKKN